MSNSLQPHRLQHTRPPCPSLFPRVFPSLCPLNQWCHPTISSSVIPFSFCLQSFPASGSFLMSQLFTSGSQSIGASASMSIQGWFPLGFTGLISLLSKGLWRVFSHTIVWKHQFFCSLPSLQSNCDSGRNHFCLSSLSPGSHLINLSWPLHAINSSREANSCSSIQLNNSHPPSPDGEKNLGGIHLAQPRFPHLVNWSGHRRKQMAHSN